MKDSGGRMTESGDRIADGGGQPERSVDSVRRSRWQRSNDGERISEIG